MKRTGILRFVESQLRKRVPKVAIIGSAGRRGDLQKMNKELYFKMVDKAKEVIRNEFKLDLKEVHLVSGGAAWSDHVAVSLYLHDEVSALTLHLPAKWKNTADDKNPHFSDNGSDDSTKDPGRTANKLHQQFSEKIKECTLQQIQIAIWIGAETKVHEGFKERNSHVARCDYLLAFTWNEDNEPKKNSGTHDTWSKCGGKRKHVPLSLLLPPPSTSKRKASTDDEQSHFKKMKLSPSK